ncbi:MAG: 1-acyl-sn-glycerol-3-phosphate acyltransferase [Clostridia bacterium]|nr:1-acyl-sn-glycerol-3-phosphate acyltransferase [Clostridia bacterium]
MAKEITAEKASKKKRKREITVKANKKGRHIIPLQNFLKALVVPFYFLLKPYRFYGNKKVKDGACIYICNHYTIFDVIYPAVTTKEGIHFIAKKPIFDAPIIGGLARKIKAISVNRDGSDVRALLDCFKCLKNNEKICVFPEGTRNKTDAEMLPFQGGAAMMAIRQHTPIVPMLIYKKPRLFRMTHILIGEPFELSEYYGRKLTEEEIAEADEKLRDRLLTMRKEHTKYLIEKKKKGKQS